MSSGDRDRFTSEIASRAPEYIALGYLRKLCTGVLAFFGRCWRGECQISVAFLSAFVVAAVIILLLEYTSVLSWLGVPAFLV